jgi:hypothetical protein
MFVKSLFAAFVLAGAIAPAAAQNLTLRDLTVTPTTPPPVVQPTQAALDAWFDRANATYALGEPLTLFARPGADGYLTAFSIGPTGDVTQLYPNAFHPDNFVRVGETVQIPGAGASAVVNGPVGLERVKIVLTRQPAKIVSNAELSGYGLVRTVIGGVSILQRDLSVVASGDQAVLALVEKTFQSVASSVSSTATSTIIVDASGYHAAPEDGTVIVIPGRGYPLPRR